MSSSPHSSVKIRIFKESSLMINNLQTSFRMTAMSEGGAYFFIADTTRHDKTKIGLCLE